MEYLEESNKHRVPKTITKNNPKLGSALSAVIGGTCSLITGISACFLAMGIIVAVGGILIFTSLALMAAAILAIPLMITCCIYNMTIKDAKPLVKIFKKNKKVVDKAKENEQDKEKLKQLNKISDLLEKAIVKIEDKKAALKKKIDETDKKLKESTILIDRVKII